MSSSNSLVQSFEQQVAAVSAQLTADIGSLQLINNNIHNRDASSASVSGILYLINTPIILFIYAVYFSEDKRKLVANIEKNFEDAKDLVRLFLFYEI